MAKYPIPNFSRREVNRAGDALLNSDTPQEEKEQALAIIDNWRTSHNFPLNTFQMRLRKVAKTINENSLVAQRLKRLTSIKSKLERFPNMNLSQLQDIGGCRAILKDIDEVEELVNIYKHDSRGIKHKLHKEDDYIQFPKPSGYRGVHLVYKYRSDKDNAYDDMKIEIQVRTLMQHAWATAVEIVDTFTRQSLKSSQGEADWLRFFALMGSAMAISESKPIVPNTPDNYADLHKEVMTLANRLNIQNVLQAYKSTIQILGGNRSKNQAKYYLLDLNLSEGTILVKSYSTTQLATATADYMTLEKRIQSGSRNVVLVSADSVESLRLAFPNYYLDADYFLNYLKKFTTTKQLSLFD